MSADKLVDSTQLDSDLTSVANAIRAKSGGSGQLAFPAGFVSEIGSIQTGGGYSISAVFTQGSDKFFTTDDLDALRANLVVTVHYSDNTSEVIDAYELSGTLTAGTSTITVTALDLETTFSVSVTAATDVTPALSNFTSPVASVKYNSADNTLLVYGTGTYKYATVTGLTLEEGMRYRISCHVEYFSGAARIGYMNSSTQYMTGCYTFPDIKASGNFVHDCLPSDSVRWSASASFRFNVTTSTNETGQAVFSKFKIIKYDGTDPADVLNVLMGGDTA